MQGYRQSLRKWTRLTKSEIHSKSVLIGRVFPCLRMFFEPIRCANYAPASKQWFADLESSWAKDKIKGFAELGIVTGKSGDRFEPDATASRAEAVTILIRLLDQ